jgi:hypothetical protein
MGLRQHIIHMLIPLGRRHKIYEFMLSHMHLHGYRTFYLCFDMVIFYFHLISFGLGPIKGPYGPHCAWAHGLLVSISILAGVGTFCF